MSIVSPSTAAVAAGGGGGGGRAGGQWVARGGRRPLSVPPVRLDVCQPMPPDCTARALERRGPYQSDGRQYRRPWPPPRAEGGSGERGWVCPDPGHAREAARRGGTEPGRAHRWCRGHRRYVRRYVTIHRRYDSARRRQVIGRCRQGCQYRLLFYHSV